MLKMDSKLRKAIVSVHGILTMLLLFLNLQGAIKFEAVLEGITFREESDEQTGHREKVIIEYK